MALNPNTHSLNIKALVINYGEGGLRNGKITGEKLFAPLPQDRVKLFAPPPPPPPIKGWKLFAPTFVWLKLQAPVLKRPQKILCPPSARLKLVPPTPPHN